MKELREYIVKDIIKKLDYDDIINCRLALQYILKYKDNYCIENSIIKTFNKFGGQLW